MSYYEDSMQGLDQIFNALVAQQSNPAPVEVDEMQRSPNDIAKAMLSLTGTQLGQESNFATGLDAMAAANKAAGEKQKDTYGGAYNPGF